MIRGCIGVIEYTLLIYYAALLACLIALSLSAAISIHTYRKYRAVKDLLRAHPDFVPSIALIAPVYNRNSEVAAFVNSLFQLNYADYEIIVVNDGSTDGTLEALVSQLDLNLYQEATERLFETKAIRATYRSATHRNLRVIDKANGGRADALNAGINAARSELVCALDFDVVVDENALKRASQTFSDDAGTVACTGIVLDREDSRVRDRSKQWRSSVLWPLKTLLSLRSSLVEELGWSSINALCRVQPGFFMVSRDALVAAGGYRTVGVGEDTDLLLRLHRHYRTLRTPYRIVYLPEVVGRNTARATVVELRRRTVHAQRGLVEALSRNLGFLFGPRSGAIGWLAAPFLVTFGWIYPIVELIGLYFIIAAYAEGYISPQAVDVYFIVTFGFAFIAWLIALLLEEFAGYANRTLGALATLIVSAAVENLVYRQLVMIWQLVGLLEAVPVPRPVAKAAAQIETV